MKQKFIITGALILLAAGIFFMIKDLLFSKPGNKTNQYEYDLGKLRKNDSTSLTYSEVKQIKTGLEDIHGVSVDTDDRIYVCGKGGVEIYDQAGEPVFRIKIDGTALSIGMDGKQNIILGIQDHIEIWNKRGELIKKWNSIDKASIITSIASTDSYVFVADAGKKVVHRFDYNGKLLNRIGMKDTVNGIPGFVIPSPYFDLGIGRDGELWLVNPGRHSFEAYTYDGKLISTWGKASMDIDGFCGCCNPSNFVILRNGSFVTSEKGIERIKMYRPDGKFECMIATPGMFIEGTKGLDLAADSKGRIIVLDPGKKLIRIFSKSEKSEN